MSVAAVVKALVVAVLVALLAAGGAVVVAASARPVPRGAGPDAVELEVRDADGDVHHGDVRIEDAPAGSGWLLVTVNTCGD